MKSVVLYLCHYDSVSVRDGVLALSDCISDELDVCVLYDVTKKSYHYLPHLECKGVNLYPFSSQSISRLQYPMIYGGQLAHNAHFPLFDFFRKYNNYKNYWLIEYDVVYTGSWREFFCDMSQYKKDFITCHIRPYVEEPWYQLWDTISHPTEHLDCIDMVRSFNPIYRISGNALEYLDKMFASGWKGQNEVTFPTLLHHGGFSIMDMGGIGSYVPSELRGRYYSSRDSNDGSLTWFGSMRYRPPRKKAGFRKNFLYHPVKPDDPRSEWFNYKHGIIRFLLEYMIGASLRKIIK